MEKYTRVIRRETRTITRYHHRLYLECGHEAVRRGPRPPKSVVCDPCVTKKWESTKPVCNSHGEALTAGSDERICFYPIGNFSVTPGFFIRCQALDSQGKVHRNESGHIVGWEGVMECHNKATYRYELIKEATNA